jgi:hypothetical protein
LDKKLPVPLYKDEAERVEEEEDERKTNDERKD